VNGNMKGITYYVVGYGSTSRTRGDVLSTISGDSDPRAILSSTTTVEQYLAKDCSYPPTRFSTSSRCKYKYEGNPSNWINAYSRVGESILRGAGNKINNYRSDAGIKNGNFFTAVWDFMSDIVTGRYTERSYADY
jgi:hypothetical protein